MLRIAFGGVACKGTSSVMSPLAVQSDGPVGFINYPLGSSYATKDAKTGDPCTISDSDTNKTYKENVMCAEPVVASTFNKELVKEYGEVLGNYSLWSNTPILWGCGTNLHRSPYNARNNEYYSEDPMLSSLTGAAFVEGGLEYGLIIAPKHYAFNDTEIDRKGISTFMTEQKAREMELRGTQECIEEAGALGVMSAFNRAGVTAVNAHYGLMYHILREEWGFKGLISEDAIYDGSFSSLKEAVICGVTLTCNTGNESVMTGHNSVAEKWAYWTTDNVKKDPVLMSALKRDMHYMLYALANSNAMDGMDVTTRYEKVNTWYDYLVLSLEVLFAAASVLSFVGYCISYKKKKEDA